MVAKKRAARKSVQQDGWLTLDGGFAARRCEVLDRSASGARITLDAAASLVSRIRLTRDATSARMWENRLATREDGRSAFGR